MTARVPSTMSRRQPVRLFATSATGMLMSVCDAVLIANTASVSGFGSTEARHVHSRLSNERVAALLGLSDCVLDDVATGLCTCPRCHPVRLHDEVSS